MSISITKFKYIIMSQNVRKALLLKKFLNKLFLKPAVRRIKIPMSLT